MISASGSEECPRHPPASEWIAYHLFHGERSLALTRFILPTVRSLLSDGLIGRFFFIRYPLGGPHIRLRVRVRGSLIQVDQVLQRAAAAFLSQAPIDPVTEGAPVDPACAFGRFPFEPEIERYGGECLLDHSLDFFFASSVRALGFVASHSMTPWPRQLTRALHVLAQQAWGFSNSETELFDQFTYRVSVWRNIAPHVCAQGDHFFDGHRDIFRSLLLQEWESLSQELMPSKVKPGSAGALAEAARRLSWEIRSASPEARRQIGTSQMHMTANRLGLSNPEEIYLGRILWRTACDLSTAEPGSWKRLLDFLAARQNAGAYINTPLADLVPAFLAELHHTGAENS